MLVSRKSSGKYARCPPAQLLHAEDSWDKESVGDVFKTLVKEVGVVPVSRMNLHSSGFSCSTTWLLLVQTSYKGKTPGDFNCPRQI